MTKRGTKTEAVELLNILCMYGRATKENALTSFKKFLRIEYASHDEIMYCLKDFREEFNNGKVEMYDFNLEPTECKEEAKYLIVSTNMTDKAGNRLGVIYGRNKNMEESELSYYYMNSPEFCKNTMRKEVLQTEYITSTKGANANYNYIENFVTKEIMEAMMFKDEHTMNKIEVTLRCLKRKIECNISENNGKHYVMNRNLTRVLYNTGFVDEYGNYILMVAETDGVKLYSQEVIRSKIKLTEMQFSCKDIEPVKLYDSKEELIFEGNMEDFDLEASSGVEHVIKDRAERFPDEVKGLSDKKMYDAIKSSIEFDLKMQERDIKWILPFYNIKYNEIQYLFPLYIYSDYTESADLVLIIHKENNIYRIGTVISVEQALTNASAVGEPNCRWM